MNGKRVRRWLQHAINKPRKPRDFPTFGPDINLDSITDELIVETKRNLRRNFDRLLKKKLKKLDGITCLEKRDIEDVMNVLVSLAVSNRMVLLDMTDRSINTGRMLRGYRRIIRSIDRNTIKAYSQMRTMQNAREKYQHALAEYQKKRDGGGSVTVVGEKSTLEKQQEKALNDWIAQ